MPGDLVAGYFFNLGVCLVVKTRITFTCRVGYTLRSRKSFSITNIYNSLAAPTNASNDFMNAVVAKDFAKAYGMIDPAQQASFGGSADALQQLFTNAGGIPSSYSFTGVTLLTNGDAVVNDSAILSGTTKYVNLILHKNGEKWNIAGLSITDNPPTPIPTSSS